jgi:lysyl-tRNA synthetase, class II
MSELLSNAVDENQLIAERRAKLAAMRAQGVAYPNDYVPTHSAGEVQSKHAAATKEQLEAANLEVSIAGRMMLKRVMGKASFATVKDGTGSIQFYINDEGVGESTHEAFKHWDMGDIIAATGLLFRTQKGELSVKCKTLRLLAKSLRPLPDKFHGLADQELKYRQRYVDLITKQGHQRHPPVHGLAWFFRGGNAHAAAHSWRRIGQAVCHAPQLTGSANVFTHCARAIFKAPDRGWF